MNRIYQIEQLLAEQPKDNFLRHALALEYLKIGEKEKAKLLFTQILTESPDYIGSYYHLAKLLVNLNEGEAAKIWYEKGLLAAKNAKDQHSYNELLMAYEDWLDE